MTLRDIFNSIIDYDLSSVIDIGIFIFAILVMIGILVWLFSEARELIDKYKASPSVEKGFRVILLLVIIGIVIVSWIILASSGL